LSAVIFQFSIFFHGLRLLRKHKKVILHANDFNTILGTVFLKRLFPQRIKTVYDCHELTPAVYAEWYGQFLGTMIGKLEKRFIRFFDAIITVSPPIKSYLQTITKEPIHIIWNYPSKKLLPIKGKQEARKYLGIDQQAFVIVYVGTLRLDIALPELIEVTNKLRKKDLLDYKQLQVIIVGDGPLFPLLKDKIISYDLSDIVSLKGRISREQSLIHLKAADLSYILFTVKGLNTKIGMPWKLFESLVSGTPVLVVDKTYAAELIQKHRAGYVVKNLEPKDIQVVLEQAIQKGQHEPLALANQFVWEKQEDQLLTVYDNLF
jgi:glycosyltransferase involved in cell wall biosynthesis